MKLAAVVHILEIRPTIACHHTCVWCSETHSWR